MNFYPYGPFFINRIYHDDDDSGNHDFYNVYVNGDYIGKKLLLTQSEKTTDVEDYLHNNDFKDFTSTFDKNTLYLFDGNENESKRLKETLNVYLNIR